MVFKVGSTTVIDNSANVPLARVTLTSSVITDLSVSVVGDNSYAYGGVYVSCTGCSLSGNILDMTWNTNCQCACDCGSQC